MRFRRQFADLFSPRRALAICAALALLIAPVGCRRHSSTPARADGATSNAARYPVSPEASVAEMRRLHRARNYAALEAYIQEAHRKSFIATLSAMEEFKVANAAVLSEIRDDVDERRLPEWDLSQWADAMGFFAPEVRVVSVDNDSRTATVHFQVGRRVPLQSEQLHWEGNRWVYDPGPSPPALVAAIRELASSLNGIARKAKRQPMTPERLNTEFRLRIVPRLNRLVAVAAELPPPKEDTPVFAPDAEMPPSQDDKPLTETPFTEDGV